MKAEFRKLKVSLVFAILLSVAFIGIVNLNDEGTASAVIIDTRVILERKTNEWPRNSTLVPGEPKSFPFTVKYTASPLGAEGNLFNNIYQTTLQVEITGADENWITVIPSERTIDMRAGDSRDLILEIDVTREAPYLESHGIDLKVTAEKKSLFQEAMASQSFSIIPDFLFFLDARAENNYAEITPGEIYRFPVEVVNDGAYPVKYFFETKGIPERWVVSQPDSLLVGGKSRETVIVSVASPYEFGYYDEIIDFTVDVSAVPFPQTRGFQRQEIDTLNFQVKNRGFSASPSGYGLFVMMGVVVLLIVVILLVFMFSNIFKKKKITEPEEKTLISKPVVEKKPEKTKEEHKKEEKKTEDSKKTEMKTKSSDKTDKLDAIKRIKEQEDKDKKKKL